MRPQSLSSPSSWEVSSVVALYVYRIKRGEMTLDQVPERWREKVRKALEDEGSQDLATGKHFAQ